MPGLKAAALALCLLSLLACSGGPTDAIAVGSFQEHRTAGWGLNLPDGWQAHASASGISLVRRLPYEGGYPTLNVRRLGADEVNHYAIDGKSAKTPPGDATYRYQKWRNALGRGYRMEALLRTPDGAVFFVDASVWDTAVRVNTDFFDRQFWPIINSVRVTKP